MSYTNTTPNFKLPQYVPTDKPTYLGDANTAYRIIDTALAESNNKASSAVDAIQNINLDTTTILKDVSDLKQTNNTIKADIALQTQSITNHSKNITDLQTNVANLKNDLADIRDDLNNVDASISTADFKKMLLTTAYPIGSIYISMSSTSPQTLIGGTWKALPGRFLIGAGSATVSSVTKSFSAGSQGGKYETYISEKQSGWKACGDEAPDDWGLYRNPENVGPTGFANRVGVQMKNNAKPTPPYDGEDPLDIMPPYLAVYMWQRTA